jgi:galactose-1-phosphate uridylyltransferase
MVYFNASPVMPSTPEEVEQFVALMRFRLSLPKDALYGSYDGPADFEKLFEKHLPIALKRVRNKVKAPFVQKEYDRYVCDLPPEENLRLCVSDDPPLNSSFRPEERRQPFLRLRISTTNGHVANPEYESDESQPRWNAVEHRIYLVRDPIRPFEIQIGEYRARRYGREPREVPFEGVPTGAELETLYPLMLDAGHRWLRVVFAELLSDPRALGFMHSKEPDSAIKSLIARNPSAPNRVKTTGCIFCDPDFRQERAIRRFESDAVIMPNDFPFGPFFHYVVFPKDQVHSWDAVEERHLFEMNLLAHKYLSFKLQHEQLDVAGVRIGFNSSIRHLVLGRRTRTSAGASVAHVHKQIWGMAPGSVNLADHLRALCIKYESSEPKRDYLREYYLALKKAGLVIWESKKMDVVVYVPFGQIAVHELQIMVMRQGARNFLDLTQDEIRSLSQAEYVVTRLYARLDINSFNEILLALPFDDKESTTFRMIFTFITREVDLAISELSLLYVVDRHPSDTVIEINRVWPTRELEDLRASPESGVATTSA